jgi:hypothetical protein
MGKYLSNIAEDFYLHQHRSQKPKSLVIITEFCRLHLNIDKIVDWFPGRDKRFFFLFSKVFTLAVESTQPPIRRVPYAFSPGVYGRERKTWPLNLWSASVANQQRCNLTFLFSFMPRTGKILGLKLNINTKRRKTQIQVGLIVWSQVYSDSHKLHKPIRLDWLLDKKVIKLPSQSQYYFRFLALRETRYGHWFAIIVRSTSNQIYFNFIFKAFVY